MKKLLLSIGAIITSASIFAQTARVQAIHNSADGAASTVDVWLTTPAGSVKLIEDFQFRTASPYIDAPAGVPITIGIAPQTSTSINDTIPGLSSSYNLTANETYVLIAEGIVSGSGYSPSTPFNIAVYGQAREEATMMGNTDVLVHHGSTDAPTVDVRERTLGATIVNDASYGDYAGYLQLNTADYILDIQDATGAVTVASYQAPLSTLNLTDSALVVVASGFLNPANNSNGPAFGLYVALPSGGSLIPLPAATAPTARVNIIHNSADAAANIVDVYVNGNKAIDNFTFRNATGFIDLPATTPLQIAIAGQNSTSINDTIAGLVYNGVNFGIDEKYVVVANGIVSATGYNPSSAVAPFGLDVYAMGQEEATMMGNTDVLVHHGATDAPTVDVDEVTAGNLVDNLPFRGFDGYLNLPTADYTLEVKDSTGTTTVKSYDAPLATLNLDDSAIVVIASGFLNPANNSNGPAFGLYVALPGVSGALIPLPESTSTGIDELFGSELDIYPNPATDIINIDGIDLQFATVTIFDVTGRVVSTSTFDNLSASSINVSNLPTGSYQLVISDNSQIITNTKFIKQ